MPETSQHPPSDPYRSPADVDSGPSSVSLGRKWLWLVPIVAISAILGVMFYAKAEKTEQTGVVDLIESIEEFGGDRRVGEPYEEIIDE